MSILGIVSSGRPCGILPTTFPPNCVSKLIIHEMIVVTTTETSTNGSLLKYFFTIIINAIASIAISKVGKCVCVKDAFITSITVSKCFS